MDNTTHEKIEALGQEIGALQRRGYANLERWERGRLASLQAEQRALIAEPLKRAAKAKANALLDREVRLLATELRAAFGPDPFLDQVQRQGMRALTSR